VAGLKEEEGEEKVVLVVEVLLDLEEEMKRS